MTKKLAKQNTQKIAKIYTNKELVFEGWEEIDCLSEKHWNIGRPFFIKLSKDPYFVKKKMVTKSQK